VSPVILFIFLLLLTFGVMVWVLAPSKRQADIQRHLKDIGNLATGDAAGVSILRQQALSSIPWVNRLLSLSPVSFRLHRFMLQAGSKWTAGALILGSLLLATFVTAAATLLISSFPIALAVGIVAGYLPFGYVLLKRDSRFRRFDAQLPEAIDLIARALRAGHSVMSAVEVVAQETSEPICSEFRIVFEEQNLGLPIREAMLNLVERMPIEDVRFLATAILVQKETGGNLAEILDKASAVMRERLRLKGQLRIYTAQGRMTGWVLCLLPFFVFIVINFVNHDYEKRLWTDPIGVRLLYAGLIMMALGIYAIRKIINIRV